MSFRLLIFIVLWCIVQVGCTEVFIEDITNESVILIAPGDSISTTNGSQKFYWEEMDFATAYDLEIAAPNFDSVESLLLIESMQDNFKDFVLDTGKYEWRVRARNEGGATKYTSRSIEIIKE